MLSEDMPKGVAHSEYPAEEKGSVSSWIVFVLIVITGLFFAYFNSRYVSDDLSGWKLDLLSQSENGRLTEKLLDKEKLSANGSVERVLWMRGDGAEVPFLMDSPQTVRMRLRAYFPRLAYGAESLTVTVNGHDAAFLKPEWNGEFARFDLVVHKKFFNPGENALAFKTTGRATERVGLDYINFRNYSGISKRFPRALVYYDGNYPERAAFARPFDYLLYPSALFVVWILAANLARFSPGAQLRETLRKSFYLFLPASTVFSASTVYSKLTNRTIAYDHDTFLVLVAAPVAVYAFYHSVRAARAVVPELWRKDTVSSFVSRVASVRLKPANETGRTIPVLRFIGRHAATTFVVLFMVCLFVAGLSMIAKRQDVAERLADVAYFSLVFGVLLRIFDLKKEE